MAENTHPARFTRQIREPFSPRGKTENGETFKLLELSFFSNFVGSFSGRVPGVNTLRCLSSADAMMINPRRMWLCKKQT